MSGGGGGYGQNGGRQQRKRPRDFDDDHYRRPRTGDTLEKLKRDLVNLADPGNVGAIEDIKYVARKLAIDFETSENQDQILDLLRDSILQLNVKTCHYATVVSLAGLQNKLFGDIFVSMISATLSQAYELRNWRDLKLLLRLLASMDRCLVASSSTTVSLLRGLLSALLEAQLEHPTVAGDHVCEVLLLTIPYLIVGTSPANAVLARESANALVESLEPYMSLRTSMLTPPQLTKDSLSKLYSQCASQVRSGWQVSYLPSFADLVEAEGAKDAFTMMPIEFAILPQEESSIHVKAYTEIFIDQPVRSTPSTSELAASLLRDLVVDILDLLVTNRKDAARFLIDLESYLAPGIFVLRGTPLDKIPSDGPSWKAEDLVVEGIFSELFALPQPRHKPVYYHSVLTELCKLVPQAVAPTFGRVIRSIFSSLEHMPAELAYRSWDWFAHHLSNFGFNWKWQEWIADLTLPPLHPKSVFIRETIMKEAELSYNQRVKTTLPVEYHYIIPDEASGPNFAHIQPEAPLFAETSALVEVLSSDSSAEQVTDALQAITRKTSENGSSSGEHETITILIQSILQIGHQSFSHALNIVERHLDLLQACCDSSPSTRRSTVAAVLQFWSGRPFIASTLLQKFLNYRIISPLSVLEEVLQNGDISSSVTWELVTTTLAKAVTRVTQVQHRLKTWQLANTAPADPTSPTGDSAMQTDGAAPMPTPAPDSNGAGSEELMRLEKTWIDVQAECKDVMTFTLHHFITRLEDMRDAEEWTGYWTRGLFACCVGKHKDHILALGHEASQLAKIEALSGIKL